MAGGPKEGSWDGQPLTRLKVTSPGVLLILAVLAAGGIFLLDVFYLRPHVESQKWAALREQALRAEHTTRAALGREEASLLGACVTLSATEPIRRAVLSEPAEEVSKRNTLRLEPQSDALLLRAMYPLEIDLVFSTSPSGVIGRMWERQEEGSGPASVETLRDAVRQVVDSLSLLDEVPATGLIYLPRGLAIVAQHALDDAEASRLGRLWAARYLDAEALGRIASSFDGVIIFVRGEEIPRHATTNGTSSHALWLHGEGELAMAWPARDAAGNVVGYFKSVMPVMQTHQQAVLARRTVLIVTSLSMGLALLVIVGSHMLVTGPVVRLLKRLQRLESGKGSAKDLVRNLHGEPLMLARRLESAFDRLDHISKTDQLTGLANRRHFKEVLTAFYHQARRYNRPLSLMVLDIDFLKAVNDAGGHLAGDSLLRAVADAIEQACRKADLPARLGGDEFAVLLPETGAEEAEAVARRIRHNVSSRPVRVRSAEMNPTMSVGICDLNAAEMGAPEAMFNLADRALYTAKELGRNRIVQVHELTGMSWSPSEQAAGKVNALCRKLAGLDDQFKSLFLRAVEEIVQVLRQRDPHMADHAGKVQHTAIQIAGEMELPARVTQRLMIAAMLQDIGMLSLPDTVLLSPKKLDAEQLRLVRKHPLLSVRIMESMQFLEQEIPAVRYHHERWDGKGYPEGISGSAIPLTARILAVADAFVAMISPRAFRPAIDVSTALDDIRKVAGVQFDPAVVDALLSLVAREGEKVLTLTEGRPQPQPVGASE